MQLKLFQYIVFAFDLHLELDKEWIRLGIHFSGLDHS